MILFGASGHSKVILDILISNGIKVDMVIDDHPKSNKILGVSVIENDIKDFNQKAIISIGDNTIRKILSSKYPFNYQTAIHPDASISEFSKIGEGTVVMAQVVINPDVEIGKHCIINTGAIIEHDCKIGDYVHISPNAALAGNIKVGEGTHVGIGASVIQGIKIGKWAIVGAGTVVINDVPDFATVVGNPGRIIKINPHNTQHDE